MSIAYYNTKDMLLLFSEVLLIVYSKQLDQKECYLCIKDSSHVGSGIVSNLTYINFKETVVVISRGACQIHNGNP